MDQQKLESGDIKQKPTNNIGTTSKPSHISLVEGSHIGAGNNSFCRCYEQQRYAYSTEQKAKSSRIEMKSIIYCLVFFTNVIFFLLENVTIAFYVTHNVDLNLIALAHTLHVFLEIDRSLFLLLQLIVDAN